MKKLYNIRAYCLLLSETRKDGIQNKGQTQKNTKNREQQYNRGFYMSAHILLNLLNEVGKVIKCEAC